jgi:murein DD-endopeptidase MepM/ murein hydrolase activator NlpD
VRRVAFIVSCLALAGPPAASARPDGPLRPYLEHQARHQLVWPAFGTITDGFGYRWGRLHTGLDIGILERLDVVAAAAGAVTQTGYVTGFEGYGNIVVMDVGEGVEMLYAHLSRVDVVTGQWLPAGDPIGLAGCTGSCTGTHLHFEIRHGGVPIDPLPVLAGASGGGGGDV